MIPVAAAVDDLIASYPVGTGAPGASSIPSHGTASDLQNMKF